MRARVRAEREGGGCCGDCVCMHEYYYGVRTHSRNTLGTTRRILARTVKHGRPSQPFLFRKARQMATWKQYGVPLFDSYFRACPFNPPFQIRNCIRKF